MCPCIFWVRWLVAEVVEKCEGKGLAGMEVVFAEQ